jgi:hypothetical protein
MLYSSEQVYHSLLLVLTYTLFGCPRRRRFLEPPWVFHILTSVGSHCHNGCSVVHHVPLNKKSWICPDDNDRHIKLTLLQINVPNNIDFINPSINIPSRIISVFIEF